MEKRKVITKILVEISRVLLGVTFIISGFTKAVDPLGTTYKVEDYITAFGVDSFYSLAFLIAMLQCVIELSVGVFMLFGIYRKWTSRITLLIMLFMTPLTLYLAIANPVSDCGCFGDAFILTNWETFFKNIVLLAASFLVLKYHEKVTNLYTGKFYWLVAFYIILFSTLFCIYNAYVEPIFDYRAYKIGADLPKLMNVEEGKGDIYENVFIYEKDGQKKEFTEDNYPWQDTTWIFVDRVNKLIKEGEKPTITDFEINRLYFNPDKTDFEGDEAITTEVLEDSSYVFLMIAYSLPRMNETFLARFEDVNNYAKEHHYKFYCLTASTKDEILKWESENSVDFNFCLTDERTLKTIIRSNPGLVLLKRGVIINKWPDLYVPSEEQLTAPLQDLLLSHPTDQGTQDKKHMVLILILFFAPLILITGFDVLIFRKRKPPVEEPESEDKNK